MSGEKTEAVFVDDVFRPPPPGEDNLGPEVEYTPLPPDDVKNIRVRATIRKDFGPMPYPVEPEDLENE